MADDLRTPSGSTEDQPPRRPSPPPPLLGVRAKAPHPKGLNKPAILIVAVVSLTTVLVLASNGLSDRTKRPTDRKPMMSDPARPEMAAAAVQKLPASYGQSATVQTAQIPAGIPVMGPPMTGDVPAFAPQGPRPIEANGGGARAAPPGAGQAANQPDEAQLAQRAGLFFQLREQPKSTTSTTPVAMPMHNPMTALGPALGGDDPGAGKTDRILFPGAVISASLVTAIDSEAPGPVIAQVTQFVYDSHSGRNVLIPQGARLIGEYRSSARYGQSRITIVWSRLIMPNGDEIKLDEPALDPSGAAGVVGRTDNHWAEVFGAAALGTLINVGAAATEDRQSLGVSLGGIGYATNQDPVDAALSQGFERTASVVTNRVINRSLAVPPTIRVAAGSRIAVIVTRATLDFRNRQSSDGATVANSILAHVDDS